jgi:hypothetical protein
LLKFKPTNTPTKTCSSWHELKQLFFFVQRDRHSLKMEQSITYRFRGRVLLLIRPTQLADVIFRDPEDILLLFRFYYQYYLHVFIFISMLLTNVCFWWPSMKTVLLSWSTDRWIWNHFFDKSLKSVLYYIVYLLWNDKHDIKTDLNCGS